MFSCELRERVITVVRLIIAQEHSRLITSLARKNEDVAMTTGNKNYTDRTIIREYLLGLFEGDAAVGLPVAG